MARERGEIYLCKQCDRWWVHVEDRDFGFCSSPDHCHHGDNPVVLRVEAKAELPVHLL